MIRGPLTEEVWDMERVMIDKMRCEECTKKGWELARKEVEGKGEEGGEVSAELGEDRFKPKFEWDHWTRPNCKECIKGVHKEELGSSKGLEASPNFDLVAEGLERVLLFALARVLTLLTSTPAAHLTPSE